MPPTRTVISGAVSVSSCARSTSISSAGSSMALPDVVAEPVRGRFQHREGLDIGLLLRRVRAARREGNLHVMPGLLRRRLDGRAAAEHDQVSQRDFLLAGLRAVELLLDRFQRRQDLRQFGRLVDFPVLLRREANARAVRPAALVAAAERGRRRPGRRDQLGDRQSGCEDLGLQRGDVLLSDQFVIDGGNRVLPDQRLLRNERAEIAHDRAHVAVRQLEPRPGERVRELIRILVEAPRDLFVHRVEPQGEVGGQHGRRVTLRRIVRIRHGAGACAILRLPLMRTGRALGQFPFVAEQVREEVVAPLRRRRGPGDFQAAADRVTAFAGAKAVRPAEALLLDAGRFRLGPDMLSPRRRRGFCRRCDRRR